MKKVLILALTLAGALGAGAQGRWTAAIDTVGATGYYNIRLSPEIIGVSGGNGFRDLRIRDENGGEVPYMVRESAPVRQSSRMEMYPLLKSTGSDSVNVLVVDNAARERIERFYIVMRAADVDKFASVRGGDEPGKWYGVRQRMPLYAERGADGNEVAVLDIPQGNYRYYEITLTNSQGSPLAVTGVGKVAERSIYGQYLTVNLGGIEVGGDRQGTVTFPALDRPYRIERMEIVIADEGFYHRAALLTTGGRTLSLPLSSKEGNVVQTNGFPVDSTTRIVILNGDNPPLKITNVRMWTLARYLCARLEADKRYTLVTGAGGRIDYDLEYFRDELNDDLPVVNTAAPVPDAACELTPPVRFFERPAFLWTVMALAGAILVGACVQALRVARKR